MLLSELRENDGLDGVSGKETTNLTLLPALQRGRVLLRSFDQPRSKRQLLIQAKAFTLAEQVHPGFAL